MNEIDRAIRRILANEDAAARAHPIQESPTQQFVHHAEATQVQQVRNELDNLIANLKSDPDYEVLLGLPSFRERIISFVEIVRSWGPRPIYGAMAGAASVVAVALFVMSPLHKLSSEHFATRVAETRDVTLPDGTHIALGPKTAMEVAFTAEERRVSVMPGETYFAVAPNSERPFVVTAGDTRITVVGTKFNVKYGNNTVRVAVVEGLVKIIPNASVPKSESVSVPAGNEAIVSGNAGRAVVESIDLSFPPDSWRTGQLYYDDVSLDEIVFDLNRYLPRSVQIHSASLGRAKLTTSFRIEQAVQFLEGLPNVLPLEIQHRDDGAFVLVDAKAK